MSELASLSRYVAVVGGYEADDAALALAEEVGRLLAQRGCIVVTGGRRGVAEAASRGAVLAGGTTIGILPGVSQLVIPPLAFDADGLRDQLARFGDEVIAKAG